MASFDAPVPEIVDPITQWMHLPRPIETPRPVSAQAEAVKGWSNIIKEGAEAGMEAYRKIGETDAYNQAKDLQNRQVNTLEAIDKAVGQNPQAAWNVGEKVGPGGKNFDILPQGTPGGQQLPDTLRNLPEVAEMIKEAKANGTFNNTMYEAHLNTLASSLRSQYPGLRKYIDSTIEQVTHEPAANAYMTALTQRINSFVGNQNTAQNKAVAEIQSFAKEGKFDGKLTSPEGAWAAYQKSGPLGLASYLNGIERPHRELAESNLKLENAQKTFAVGEEGRKFQQQSSYDAIYKYYDDNFNEGMKRLGDTSDIAAKLMENPNDPVALQQQAVLQNYLNTFTASMRSSQLVRDNMRLSNMDPKKLKEIEDSVTEPLINAIKMYGEHKGYLAEFQKKQNEAITDAAYNGLLTSPKDEVRQSAVGIGILGKMKLDPQSQKVAADIMFGNSGPKTWYDEVVRQDRLKAFTQPNRGNPNAPYQGVSTIYQDFDNARKTGKLEGTNFYKNLAENVVKDLTNVKDPTLKANLVDHLFGQENVGITNKLAVIDPKTAAPAITADRSGIGDYYQLMTSPKVRDAIYGSGDASMIKKYEDWYVNEANKIFGNEVANVNTMVGIDPRIRIRWDPDHSQFSIDYGKFLDLQDHALPNLENPEVERVPLELAKKSIFNLNRVLNRNGSGLATAVQGRTKDPDAVSEMLLATLTRPREQGGMGFNLRALDPDSVPMKIANAIASANRQKEFEDVEKENKSKENIRKTQEGIRKNTPVTPGTFE